MENQIMETKENVEKVNNVNSFSLNFKFKITDKDLVNILDIAFYDGITYWAKIGTSINEKPVSERIVYDNEKVIIIDTEEEDEFELDKTLLIKGIKRAIKNGHGFGNYSLEGKWVDIINKTLDVSQIDSLAADVIIQYALFKEVIYG
jgi:accessory colonization factor AcfC